MARIQTLLAEMTQVAAEQLLHPGDSKLSLQMLVDHQGERQLTVDSKARYLGLDGNNLPADELMALNEAQIQQMLDVQVRVDMHESLVPAPYVARLTALAEQGVVERQGERWSSVLSANGGALSLNGQPVSPEELQERMKAISGPAAAPQAAEGEAALDDPLAPIAALTEAGGWALLLGVDHTVNTSIHYGEQRAGRRQFIRWALTYQGVIECPRWPGCSGGFNEIAPHLEWITQKIQVGNALVQAIPLQPMIEIVQEILRENPMALLCDRPDCERCNAVRASVERESGAGAV
jgi:hypothetical protein